MTVAATQGTCGNITENKGNVGIGMVAIYDLSFILFLGELASSNFAFDLAEYVIFAMTAHD